MLQIPLIPTLLISLATLSATAFADELPVMVTPPANHLILATPGSSWLNVSRALTADDFRNRIVLIDFWNSGSTEGSQLVSELAKLQKDFAKDIVMVGVHSAKFDHEKETDSIRQALLRDGVPFAVVNDRDFRIWRGFDIRERPTLVLLRPDGEIEQTFRGGFRMEEVRKAIAALIKKSPKREKSGLPVALEKYLVAQGELYYPTGIAYDDASHLLYVSDTSHHQIAAFTWDVKLPTVLKPAFRIGTREVPGLVNGSFKSARFNRPHGIVVSNGALYVADTENQAIRKIDLKAKTVSTIAGNGKRGILRKDRGFFAKSAELSSPWDVTFHPDENHLAIAMAGFHQLWSLDLKSGKFSIVAGDGVQGIKEGLPGENQLAEPTAVSSLLGSLYFLDSASSSLRFYFESYVRTLVGGGLFDFGSKDGERKKASLQHPMGLYADVTGVYIADTFNHSIRRYDPSAQTMETLIGDGKPGESGEARAEDAKKSRLNEPSGVTKLTDGFFAITDTSNHRIVLWTRGDGKVEKMRIQGEKVASVAPDAETAGKLTEVVAGRRMSLRLPNVKIFPDAKVNRKNPEFNIHLPERYKLAAEGASVVRLFEGPSPKERLLREWKAEELRSSLRLKLDNLSADKEYFLQGTLTFCLDTKNAICEIRSFSFPVHVDASGANEMDISL